MDQSEMTTAEIMSRVVTGVIESTVTVETTIAKCFELKQPLLEKLIYEEYMSWHNEHLNDASNPTVFLHDLVLWTQERTRHHIELAAVSRVIN